MAGSRKIKLIHEQVKKIKLSEKMGVKYMQRWEEIAYARQEGRLEGRQDGKTEGETLKLIKLICKKMKKGKNPAEIAEDLEEEIESILPIYDLAMESAPEYDCEKIYGKLRTYEGAFD